MLITTIGVTVFIVQFVIRQREIAKILTTVSDFRPYGEPPNIDQLHKTLSLYYYLYMIFINGIVLAFFLQPYVTRKSCENQNLKQDFQENCGFFLPIWAPFRLNYSPVNQIVHVWEGLGLFLVNTGGSFSSFLMVESMDLLRYKIAHLNLLLIKAVEEDDLTMLRKCVHYHQDILR